MEIKFKAKEDSVDVSIDIEDIEMNEANIMGIPETMGFLQKIALDAISKADMEEVIFIK